MKIALHLNLSFLLIICSCTDSMNKTSLKKTLTNNSQEPLKLSSQNQDCPVKSLAGIMINDVISTKTIGTQLLWDEVMRNSDKEPLPEGKFLNSDKSATLKFVFHPGGEKFQISEFTLTKVNQDDLSLPILENIKDVKTNNGLHLGQSLNEVVSLLKDVAGLSLSESLIDLRIESTDPSKSACLKKHNMPIYYLKIAFDKDKKMDSLKFGYEYP